MKLLTFSSGERPRALWALLLTHVLVPVNLQVVSQYSNILSPIAVDSVLRVVNPAVQNNVDLNDIKIVKKLG